MDADSPIQRSQSMGQVCVQRHGASGRALVLSGHGRPRQMPACADFSLTERRKLQDRLAASPSCCGDPALLIDVPYENELAFGQSLTWSQLPRQESTLQQLTVAGEVCAGSNAVNQQHCSRALAMALCSWEMDYLAHGGIVNDARLDCPPLDSAEGRMQPLLHGGHDAGSVVSDAPASASPPLRWRTATTTEADCLPARGQVAEKLETAPVTGKHSVAGSCDSIKWRWPIALYSAAAHGAAVEVGCASRRGARPGEPVFHACCTCHACADRVHGSRSSIPHQQLAGAAAVRGD